MTRSQEVQVRAILARFNGDQAAAIQYCCQMAANHPRLAEEYNAYYGIIADKMVIEHESRL
jgi:hypothetical protein